MLDLLLHPGQLLLDCAAGNALQALLGMGQNLVNSGLNVGFHDGLPALEQLGSLSFEARGFRFGVGRGLG